jgi:LysM domain
MRRAGILAATATADAAALTTLRPPWRVVGAMLDARAWLAAVGTDAAVADVAAAALWCAALWLAVALLACAGTVLPGLPGRLAGALVRVVVPRTLYRLAAGAAGVGVFLAPLAAEAARTPAPRGTARPTVPPVSAPGWSTSDPLPAPAWPSTTPGPGAPATGQRPAPPAPSPEYRARPPADEDTGPRHARAAVVVRPGDCLWRIAARQLPPPAAAARIARSWPRWYAANRAVIGADPDHIVPGQVLRAPAEEDQP